MHVTNLSMHIRGDRAQVFNGVAGFDQLVVLLSQSTHSHGALQIPIKYCLGSFQTKWAGDTEHNNANADFRGRQA